MCSSDQQTQFVCLPLHHGHSHKQSGTHLDSFISALSLPLFLVIRPCQIRSDQARLCFDRLTLASKYEDFCQMARKRLLLAPYMVANGAMAHFQM